MILNQLEKYILTVYIQITLDDTTKKYVVLPLQV